MLRTIRRLVSRIADTLVDWVFPRPRTTKYFFERPAVRFIDHGRTWVRNVINSGRPRNAQGGLNWTREDYIAYALCRPVPSYAPDTHDTRTARFRRHEMFANDNINYEELARILWECELVSVDGETCNNTDSYVPWGLVEFCEDVAPWLPKPPNHPRRRIAA